MHLHLIDSRQAVLDWILNRDGRVFGFGASRVLSSPTGPRAAGLAAHPGGDGYWVVRRNGGVSA
ncbi:MAG: hypothetical protein KY410_10180, partial [Proteobacteria bacterium]|nr:hypothetical protein [Pseudomonadota bacterium]